MSGDRQGPELRPVGSCIGCAHLAIVGAWKFCRAYDRALDRDPDTDSSPGTLRTLVTPSWCPLWADGRRRLIAKLEAEEEEERPYVCPGCHAVAERCAPDCIEAEHELDQQRRDEEDEYEHEEPASDRDWDV